MQTFLPYADFVASAAVLDDRRLGKQRVETFQVLRALTWPSYGWKHHPVVRMWRGFTPALVSYGIEVCRAWEERGYVDAVSPQLRRFSQGAVRTWEHLRDAGELPPWVGSEPLHRSHRSALVRKEPERYGALFPDVPDDLPYVWPTPVFPRWPVRRGRDGPASLDEALALLGFDEARAEQRAAVESLAAGRDVTLALPPGGGARTTALLAGLCTPGWTLWLLPGDAPVAATVPVLPRSADAKRAPGRVSASVAREPSGADVEAMALEARSAPEFRFVHAAQLAIDLRAVGLIVLDRVTPDDLPAGVRARLRRINAPVLRLSTLD